MEMKTCLYIKNGGRTGINRSNIQNWMEMKEMEWTIIAHGKHRFKQKWKVTDNRSVKQKALNFLADCTYLTL